ncbi:MAG TPA: nitroreductase family protein [Syntrophobacteria bacterium]|nr:nitroreductase family protein [Syntrophobacteria bacterium]
MKNPYFIKLVRKPSELERHEEEVLLTQIRVKAHLLDKELQTSTSKKIRFSPVRLQDLSERLREYRGRFETVKPDYRWAERIGELYTRAVQEQQQFRYPWSRKKRVRLSASQFEKLLTTRRSIRRFTKKAIDDDLIRKILTLAHWAPTNCNQQSLWFVVVTAPEVRKQLVQGGMHGAMSPCIIAVLADMRFYSPVDIECPAHDAGAAIQTMLLAIHFYGLGACYTSSLGSNSKKNRALLRVREHEKIMALVWAGHYEHEPLSPARREVAEIIRYL